jgi:AcrR family transcriptional regulator
MGAPMRPRPRKATLVTRRPYPRLFRTLTDLDRRRYLCWVTSQERRRADTRARLLEAAADLIAERGIEGSSIDAIAEAADRTSGAVYDHFGGKEGLLFALLQRWLDDVAVVIDAEVATATNLDEVLGALWRNVVSPPPGRERWIALEHELWSWAVRHPGASEHLARRYRGLWTAMEQASAEWAGAEPVPGSGAAVTGALLGLAMMRRVDPTAIDDAMAVAVLRSALTRRIGEEVR